MKLFFLIAAIFFSFSALAGTNRSVLSVKISETLPPGFCVVTRTHLGKFGHYVSSGNVSTFASMAGGSSGWGNTSDTGVGPTKINVDVASISSEIEIKPIAAAAPGAGGAPSVVIDGESGASVAMVNAQGLPTEVINGSSDASWLGTAAGSAVIVHDRDASSGSLTVRSTHHFNGSSVKVLLTPGKYTFFIAPGFSFAAANTAKAFKWHLENKGKHWPFEMLCVAKPR